MNRRKNLSLLRECVLFAMFGALMFVSKLVMEGLPNVHMLATFIIAFTVVYRVKALIPIYVFVFLTGIYAGFSLWWIPYLYIWLPLWALAMILPKKMPKWLSPIVYCAAAGLHGILYGTLYAPAQALMFGFDFQTTVKWIMAGLPWDFVHAIGNTAIGILIVPFITLLTKLESLSSATGKSRKAAVDIGTTHKNIEFNSDTDTSEINSEKKEK